MQHEFDNTLAPLLRRAAQNRGDVLPENDEHLDADSISAFVENALPAAAHERLAAHFADCADCRQILAIFALTEPAEETETVEEKPVVTVSPTFGERLRRWLALPNLGYAAAALTVLLVGVFGFIAFQSSQKTEAPQIAQTQLDEIEKEDERKRRSARIAAPPPEQTPENTPEPAPESQANSSDLNNANLSGDSNQSNEQSPNRGLPPSYRAIQGQNNSSETVAATRRELPDTPKETSNRAAANVSNTATAGNVAQPSPNAAAKPSPERMTTAVAAATNNSNAQKTVQSEKTRVAEAQILQNRADKSAAATNAKKPIAARMIGGKTFQNLDGVWRDQLYSGQAVIDVARGSDEYKKLDANLRSVADNFAGATVIVVWQGKAYRIR